MMKRRIFLIAVLVTVIQLGVSVSTSNAARNTMVYDDALSAQWADWSWNTTLNYNCSDPVHSGQYSLSVEHVAAWGGLYLHTDNYLDSSILANVRFMIHGGTSGNHSLSLRLYDGDLTAGPEVFVTSQAGVWSEIIVSIADLGNPSLISGIALQENSGIAQNVYFLDNIEFVSVTGTPTPTPTAVSGPDLSVNAASEQHSISPYIYGMSFANETLAAELTLPVNRWGGNSTTRYNWQLDTSNRAMDWYYENIPNENAHPELLPDGSASDLFHEQNQGTGTETLMTMPMIGWTPKDRAFSCGFSVALYGPQQSVDPWAPDCGNGVDTSGVNITGNNPLDTCIAIDETFIVDWLGHLTSKYGFASTGGIKFYNLGNEPMLWNDTHRDVHPESATYNEIRDRLITYGTAVKSVDPSAETLGPVTWGWTAYFYSALDWEAGGSWWQNPVDRNAHGGTPFTEWLLNELKLHETSSGIRVMDYLDLHYYPQADNVALTTAGNRATQELRLRATRSFWDVSYTDESWINEPVYLLPRMKNWIDALYPGLKRAVSEYNFGGLEHINGAVTQAEVLGIFGREELEFACLWDPPAYSEPGAFAFRMYLNYDSSGSRFGSKGVDALSTQQDNVTVYASLNTDESVLTVMVINKSFESLTCPLEINGFAMADTMQGYRYSDINLNLIQDLGLLPVAGSGIELTYPAQSITLLEIESGNCVKDGDVNGDNSVTASDAQAAFEIVLGYLEPTYQQACAADCNGDDIVTAADAQQIFLKVLGSASCSD